MKIKTCISAFTLAMILCSCGNYGKSIEGDWIEIDKNFPYVDKDIYSFNRKNVSIQNFNFEYGYHDNQIKKGDFEIKGESLVLCFDEKLDTLEINFDNNGRPELKRDNGIESFLVKIEHFESKKQRELLNTVLTESIFKFSDDTVRYEFSDDGKFYTDAIGRDFPSGQMWNIEEFKDELFLVIGYGFGPMMQLMSVNRDTIQLKYYSDENQEWKLHKTSRKHVVEQSLLIGKWVKEVQGEFDVEELLNISDSIIIKKTGDRIEEQNWILSKIGNVIVTANPWKKERKPQWNIKNVTEYELQIVRNLDVRLGKIEAVKFKRKNEKGI